MQYKTEKDGVIETRIEKKVVVSGDSERIDHDKVYKLCVVCIAVILRPCFNVRQPNCAYEIKQCPSYFLS